MSYHRLIVTMYIHTQVYIQNFTDSSELQLNIPTLTQWKIYQVRDFFISTQQNGRQNEAKNNHEVEETSKLLEQKENVFLLPSLLRGILLMSPLGGAASPCSPRSRLLKSCANVLAAVPSSVPNPSGNMRMKQLVGMSYTYKQSYIAYFLFQSRV